MSAASLSRQAGKPARAAFDRSPGHFSKQQQQQLPVWCIQARIVLPTWASGHDMHVAGPSHSLKVSDFGLSRTLSSAGCKSDSFGTVRCAGQMGGGHASEHHAAGSSLQAGMVKHAAVCVFPRMLAGSSRPVCAG